MLILNGLKKSAAFLLITALLIAAVATVSLTGANDVPIRFESRHSAQSAQPAAMDAAGSLHLDWQEAADAFNERGQLFVSPVIFFGGRTGFFVAGSAMPYYSCVFRGGYGAAIVSLCITSIVGRTTAFLHDTDGMK